MEKINLVELLKDCPKGMELDCTMYDSIEFNYVLEGNAYPIKIETPDGKVSLNKYGCYSNSKHAKCIIFPKGKTSWEGFIPLKEGDVIISTYGDIHLLRTEDSSHCSYRHRRKNKLDNTMTTGITVDRLATEEEKQLLFDAIKDNGYKWNAETKTLEVLPKFKVGDRVKKKDSNEDVVLITDIADNYYIVETKYGMEVTISMSIQNNYELVPNKFDINTLKPFDKVVVRDSDKEMWRASMFSHTWKDKFFCVDAWHNQCIPYEANKDLIGTTNDCEEYYKTWE